MALYVKQDENRTELQERIAADLREKAIRNSMSGEGGNAPEAKGFSPEESNYLEGTKETTSLALVWVLLFVAVVITIGYFVWFAKA
jgi:hypothetical protein